jgi:hypothetical protein
MYFDQNGLGYLYFGRFFSQAHLVTLAPIREDFTMCTFIKCNFTSYIFYFALKTRRNIIFYEALGEVVIRKKHC